MFFGRYFTREQTTTAFYVPASYVLYLFLIAREYIY